MLLYSINTNNIGILCSGITKLAASPEDQCAAFATAGNKIFTFSLDQEREYLQPVQVKAQGRMADPIRSLVWNSRTKCLLAAVGSSVVVFRRPMNPDGLAE